MSLTGFVSSSHPLSLNSAMQKIGMLTGSFATYTAKDLWEIDTLTLPAGLQQYRRKLKKFAEQELRPHALELDATHNDELTLNVLKKAARAGLLSDIFPAPLGSGSILNASQPLQLMFALKTEELATACGGMALLIAAHGLGLAPILLSGDMKAIARFGLPILNENRKGNVHLAAFAITEASAGSDVEDSEGASKHKPQTVAEKVNGGWILNGRKIFISGGNLASTIIVFAAQKGQGMESWTCFVVEKDFKGYSVVRNEIKMGQRASSATEILFEDVFVPDTHIIGKPGDGWGINRVVLNYSRIPVGSIALGIAQGAVNSAIDFVRSHTLAGKTLINYQEIQMAIAQMLMETMAMRSMIRDAAKEWTARQFKASSVKIFCGDTAVKVCYDAMDIMGNHGLMQEHYAEKCFRDARLNQIYEGTNQINRLAMIEDQMHEFI